MTPDLRGTRPANEQTPRVKRPVLISLCCRRDSARVQVEALSAALTNINARRVDRLTIVADQA